MATTEIPHVIISGGHPYVMPPDVYDNAVLDFHPGLEGCVSTETLALSRALFSKQLITPDTHRSLIQVTLNNKVYQVYEYLLLLSQGLFALGPGNGPGNAQSPEQLAVGLGMSQQSIPPPYSIPRDENWLEIQRLITVPLVVDGKEYLVPEIQYVEAQTVFRPRGGNARTPEDLAVAFAMFTSAVPRDELWQDRLQHIFCC